MKFIAYLLVVGLFLSFLGFGCSGTRTTMGPTEKQILTDNKTGKETVSKVFIDGKDITFHATNWGLGGGTTPIDLATAEAIRKDADNRVLNEQMKNAVLADYMNNPAKYGNGKLLEKAGIISTTSGGYEVLVFNDTGRPLNVAVSGSAEGFLLRDKGYQSFFVDTRNFSVYTFETDNTPFKSKVIKIPSPTPKIPAFGRNKLYAAFVTITNKR